MTLLVNDDIWAFDLVRALENVSPERRAKALAYRHELDQRLSVSVYLLLKTALSNDFGMAENPRLAYGANGKPFLPDRPDLHFNLSHCPQAAACVVSDRPVGVDVEEIKAVDEDLARRVLSASEWAAVRESDEPEVAFARFWTQKEALVKLSGACLDDGHIACLLENVKGIGFKTIVNRKIGYAVTVANAHRGSLRGLQFCEGVLYNTGITERKS